MTAACTTVDAAVFDDPDPWPAIHVCLTCPELFACRWWAYRTDVSGVAGAVTEEEREQWRAAWNVTPTSPPITAFLDDRTVVQDAGSAGHRMSPVIGEIVARRSAHGQSGEEIAAAIGTTARRVVRYRAWLASGATAPTHELSEASA